VIQSQAKLEVLMPMHLVAAIILACLQAHDPKPANCNPADLEYLYQSAQVTEQARQQTPDVAIQQGLRRLRRDLQRLFIPPEHPPKPHGVQT